MDTAEQVDVPRQQGPRARQGRQHGPGGHRPRSQVYRDGRRFAELIGIGRRHGLLPYGRLDFSTDPATAVARAAQARELRLALEEAGGAFVKMGQLFSTRDDMLPVEWTTELSLLQQRVAPAPWPAVEALLDSEYGAAHDAVFESFDEVPIAAASLGQVHRARLRSTGETVAVKVQRPGIEAEVRRDVDIARRAAHAIARVSPDARQVGLGDIADQYAADLLRQLDFRREGRNLAALHSLQAKDPDEQMLRLPGFRADLSTDRVLVMEFLEGETLSEWNARQAGLPPRARPDQTPGMRRLLRAFLRQLVLDGFYHADLHPGNVMRLPDGDIALVDFGSVGRLDNQLRGTVQELLIAYLQGDTQRIADGLLTLAPLRDGADERAFRRDIGLFIADDLGPGAEVSVETVDRLVDVASVYGLTIPAEFVAAARAFAILEGTLRTTAPGFDLLEESRVIASEQIREQMRPANVWKTVTAEVLGVVPGLRRLPRRLDRIGLALEEGTLNVNVRLLSDRRDRRLVISLLRQALLTAVAVVCGVLSLSYLTRPEAQERGVLTNEAAGLGLGVVCVVLLGAVLVTWWAGRRHHL